MTALIDKAARATGPLSVPLAGKIGPNAIIRMGEALVALEGQAVAAGVFGAAGIAHLLCDPPGEMVPEDDVASLHASALARLGPNRAATAGWLAGHRTGDYLLANRIPKPAQAVLRAMPARLASRALLSAIGRHTWTFAGSGHVELEAGNPTRVTITRCPLCRHIVGDDLACTFYVGTFERLYRELVHGAAVATETSCQARGDPACMFEIAWPSRLGL